MGDFSDDPVVEEPCFQGRWLEFSLLLGNYSHRPWDSAKKNFFHLKKKSNVYRGFPSGPAVKTLSFHCRGRGFVRRLLCAPSMTVAVFVCTVSCNR